MDFGRRFWVIETVEEGRIVEKVLRRRFPEVFSAISEILQHSDPLDIVYPGNPNEYSDVVREIIVLLAPIGGDIALLSADKVENLLKEGLGRCFDDEPLEDRLKSATNEIVGRFGVR